jgi:hypothetical protein
MVNAAPSANTTKLVMMNDMSLAAELGSRPAHSLPPSDVSFCVAIIPSSPVKDHVVAASVGIARSFENNKLIDNRPFPAHVTLHLGGARREDLPDIGAALKELVPEFFDLTIWARKLYTNARGFLAVECDMSDPLAKLSEAVLDVCGAVQEKHPTCRPHLLEIWDRLTVDQQDAIRRYGTYKVSGLDRHISIAQVDPMDTTEASLIARKFLRLPQQFTVDSFAFADIGHRNEKWRVLDQWVRA